MSKNNGRDRDPAGRFLPGNKLSVGHRMREQYGNQYSQTHGSVAMRKRLMQLGNRFIDRRYTVGRELSEWRDNVIRDLGGESEISTLKREILDQIVQDKFIVDALGGYILNQKNLVRPKSGTVLPAILERQRLIDSLTKRLAMLGLERRSKDVTNDLNAYLDKVHEDDAEQL